MLHQWINNPVFYLLQNTFQEISIILDEALWKL